MEIRYLKLILIFWKEYFLITNPHQNNKKSFFFWFERRKMVIRKLNVIRSFLRCGATGIHSKGGKNYSLQKGVEWLPSLGVENPRERRLKFPVTKLDNGRKARGTRLGMATTGNIADGDVERERKNSLRSREPSGTVLNFVQPRGVHRDGKKLESWW